MKHHNAYVTNGNLAMEKLAEATYKGDTASIIAMQMPSSSTAEAISIILSSGRIFVPKRMVVDI